MWSKKILRHKQVGFILKTELNHVILLKISTSTEINPFNLTIVTVKKVFIYKALKSLLTDVLVTSCKYGNNKASQLNMCSVTWLVQIVTWPELNLEKMLTASKLWNKRLVKYVNINIWQRFLVHMIFRVSSINTWIHIYSVLLSVVIQWVNMLMYGITVNIGIQYKSSCSCLWKLH